jgi:hypothetical protein
VTLLLSTVAALREAEHEAEKFLGLPLWIWQLANLVAFLWVLGYLVARPLAQAFRRRQDVIEERIKQARAAKRPRAWRPRSTSAWPGSTGIWRRSGRGA